MNSNDKIQCTYKEMLETESLKPHPENPNRHGETQIAILADLIRTVGWRYPIVVSKRSGFIVSGHARWLAAKRIGLKQVPVDIQDFESADDESLQLLGDNKIPELSHRDNKVEADLLQKLLDNNRNTLLAGYRPKELDEILKNANLSEVLRDDEVIPDMEIQPHEHYDYIVLFFKNDYDWMKALQVFGIQDVNYGQMAERKRIGLGRVVDGARILQEFFDAKSDSQSGPVGHDHDA